MFTECVTYDDGSVRAEITVSAATGMTEYRRARLRLASAQYAADFNLYILHTAYCDFASTCVGTIEAAGQTITLTLDRPLTFDQYIDPHIVPFALDVQVQSALYRLNPAWDYKRSDLEPDEKKAPNSGAA